MNIQKLQITLKTCTYFLIGGAMVLMTGCQTRRDFEHPKMQLKEVSYSQLPGWDEENLKSAMPAIQSTCQKLKKLPKEKKLIKDEDTDFKGAKAGDWHAFCDVVASASAQELGLLVKRNLQPYQVLDQQAEEGTFTGYYEPQLKGSWKKQGKFQTPLLKLPPKHVSKNISRLEIMKGALHRYAFLWVDDPIDSFFLEIQGSGRVELSNGQVLRVRYAGQNGHPYVAIGKVLLDEGHLCKQDISMQSIKKWLVENPHQAKRIFAKNPSYVFFKINDDQGPIGAQGVVLTPGHSLAIDPTYIPLGSLLWVDIKSNKSDVPNLQRLMVAQDTGGAIKGVIRGDVFFGHGKKAEHHAGYLKGRGGYFLLLPK